MSMLSWAERRQSCSYIKKGLRRASIILLLGSYLSASYPHPKSLSGFKAGTYHGCESPHFVLSSRGGSILIHHTHLWLNKWTARKLSYPLCMILVSIVLSERFARLLE